jgi:homoserine kinase type II
MSAEATVLRVLARYGAELQPQRIEPLGGAGGFSGASFWRIAAPAGKLCLRRWPPEHPSPERLAMIHSVLAHVSRHGFHLAAQPHLTSDGASFVQHDRHLWELTPWLPGRADYRAAPSDARLKAALEALAQFHLAAAAGKGIPSSPAPSPGLSERLGSLHRLQAGECDQIEALARRGGWPEFSDRAREWFALYHAAAPNVERQLAAAARLPLPLQPAIRDIWHDHVLFSGDRVSGLVDFGALRIDSPAGDVARLLGSLAQGNPGAWRTGLAAYEQLRPLSPAERQALTVFDCSTVLLSGVNWLRWIFVEGRQFDDRRRVLERFDEHLVRLAGLR